MLDHIEDEKQIKKPILLLSKIGKLELQSVIGPALGEFESLRRDVVSPEKAVATQIFLKLLEYFSRATSHVSDALRRKLILPKHANDLPRFPGGLFSMPRRILCEIFASYVNGLTGHDSGEPRRGKQRLWAPAQFATI